LIAVAKPKYERVAVGRHALFFLVLIVLSIGQVATARAAAPQVLATWATSVQDTSAALSAHLDCGGLVTGYRFEYIRAVDLVANEAVGREGFFGAARVPQPDANAGKCAASVRQTRQANGLQAGTEYRYRVVAHNTDGTTIGPEAGLTTRASGAPAGLLDGRGWEMVTPVEKNGGAIEGFGGNNGGGVLQAAVQGGAMSYSARTSFGEGGEGAPGGSQYVAERSASGWTTRNISPAMPSSGYGPQPEGVPYQLFSPELARGLLTGVPDPPLPGTDAPAGYANYYLRDAAGAYTALLGQADVAGLGLSPADFSLAFSGASPDLGHVVLSTCAALTVDAVEVPGTAGCDLASPNLYEWSPGGLRLVNVLPGHSDGTPPGRLAAPSGAVSSDGSRVYWTDGTALYLREGSRTVQVAESVGGGATFQLATPDGAVAFFTKAEHLYRYDVGTEATADLTPGGGVTGVLGASGDGAFVYFATASGISLSHGGGSGEVAPAPDPINFPPSSGTARVSADGLHLLFVSAAQVTLYDNSDPDTGARSDEVYLYDAATNTVTCVSCNPSGEPPIGSASIPGAVANGIGSAATRIYKPRVLSADGRRVFFDSPDRLVDGQGPDAAPDVFEWEAAGTGSCVRPQGCLALISSGRPGGATFVDASADGADVFFLTAASLVKADPDAVDIYDAREGGGFPEPEAPIPCEEDACQPLPPPPDDPSPGTLAPSTGNPPVHFPKGKKKAKKHRKKKAKKHRKKGHGAKRRGAGKRTKHREGSRPRGGRS
jgi:hypothetical protein